MITFLLKRLALVIPALFGVSLFSFALIHLIPGDPVMIMAGIRGMSAERHAQMMHQLGLDLPLYQQYFNYVWNALHGNLGTSIFTRQPVMTEFLQRFPATFELSLSAILFAIIIGLPAGVLAAIKRGTFIDHTVMTVSLTGYSMPIFWWGLLLILLFSVQLGWTPVSGRLSPEFWVEPRTGFLLIDTLLAGNTAAFWDALRHLILPAIVLGTIPLAMIARMTRSSMLEVLNEDYVRTARAKGASPLRVIMIHALRNALIPVVTVTGLQVGVLLAGAILTETIFSWPGIGQWMVQAINQRDYPVVQGGILLIASMIILVNLLVDITYGIINPRIRYAR
ncbi:ABC transporter permease subunit [Acidihalobacter ferrooxydans]|uniref:Peptide ABC transporter permease n=1 Tax=Acidihalobacter ferrooxydans TaxID=1765967 RepID=A0A1P8UK01_9GAMM|nr:ABC transporter permease subunit [Acidihalobacter ferrooxydans]APZ44169.1 peptide ABC transporter permease [Acidihalobacter ferrooxydans]